MLQGFGIGVAVMLAIYVLPKAAGHVADKIADAKIRREMEEKYGLKDEPIA